jgi:hypothetical protein
MNDQTQEPWGERLAAEGAAAADEPSLRRLLTDAIGVVRGRLGEVSRVGVRPLLDEAAAQVRPATLQELRDRYPGLPDDEVARRLIDRAAKTAAGLALLVGGVIAAQQAMAAASAAAPRWRARPLAASASPPWPRWSPCSCSRPSSGPTWARSPASTPSARASWRPTSSATCRRPAAGRAVRGRSLRRALPDAAARRAAARLAVMVPARFARIVIPEVIAPLIGSAVAARLAARQIRSGGERHWGALRTMPRTTTQWGPPVTPNGGRPPAGWHPSGWGPPPGDEPRQLPPPDR